MHGAKIKMTKYSSTNIATETEHAVITVFFSEVTYLPFPKKYASVYVLISLRCPTALQKRVITRSVKLRQLPSYANVLV